MSLFELDEGVVWEMRDEIVKVDVKKVRGVEGVKKVNEMKKIVRGR